MVNIKYDVVPKESSTNLTDKKRESKKFGVKKIFGLKKIFRSKKNWVKKLFCKKILGSKSWGQNKLGSK